MSKLWDKVSLYVDKGHLNDYRYLQSYSGDRSVSQFVCHGIHLEAMCHALNLNISDGALCALSDGNFQDLCKVELADGVYLVSVKEAVYKEKYQQRTQDVYDLFESVVN